MVATSSHGYVKSPEGKFSKEKHFFFLNTELCTSSHLQMANFIFFFTLAITGLTGILGRLSKTISANYLSQSRCSKMPTMLPPSKTSFILYRKVHKAALTPEARPASSYGYFVDIFLSQFLYMVLDKSPVSFFCMWIFSFPSPICCKNCPFLWALAPLSRILCLDVRGFISKLSVPFHWSIYMSVYMPVPHCFDN